jgi:hypothetical protein
VLEAVESLLERRIAVPAEHRKSKASPSSKRRQQKPAPLPPDILRRLRKEASSLGLSSSEFLRITLRMSELLRSGVGDSASIDLHPLVPLVDSPLFSFAARSLLESFMNNSGGSTDEGGTSLEANAQNPAPPATVPRQPANPPYPEWMFQHPASERQPSAEPYPQGMPPRGMPPRGVPPQGPPPPAYPPEWMTFRGPYFP